MPGGNTYLYAIPVSRLLMKVLAIEAFMFSAVNSASFTGTTYSFDRKIFKDLTNIPIASCLTYS